MHITLCRALRHHAAICAVVVAALACVVWTLRRGDDRPGGTGGRVAPAAEVRLAIPPFPAPGEPVPMRPLPVATRSARHEWTQGDGADPTVIGRIAHNPDEFIRMVEENDRILRRQLVYRHETAAAVVQRAAAAGEPVRRLVLPALDGRELEFEVTRADLSAAGTSGTFTGRLAGVFDSLVTLAFKGDREAFSVASPSEGLHLQADPREPGEIIVKHIDPATYIQGVCGTPDAR